MPRPFTRSVRPLGVPGAIRTVTSSPAMVGTLMSAPSAASANVTGNVIVKFSPLREKIGWGLTWS